MRLGLRANAAQFVLLVLVNAFVGAMVGLERSTLPLVGREEFGLSSSTAVLSFLVAFGVAKAFSNLFAGARADAVGRRRLLIAGWLIGLPVPVLILVAPSWWVVVAANFLLGVNQGLAWSMTVVMKIDLVGPVRRGLALGLNESAGYAGVAIAAAAAGWLAADLDARDVLAIGGLAIALTGLGLSLLTRDTGAHAQAEHHSHGAPPAVPSIRRAFVLGSFRDRALAACSQAGLVNNLNDALAWGIAPLFLAAHGASLSEIGLVAGAYPAVWGVGQLLTGALSDRIGRKPPIVAGMLVQAIALVTLVASEGRLGPALGAAALLGAGTALVYPTLIAAVSDRVTPLERPAAVGVYRFWRDAGYAVGGVLAGTVADAGGFDEAILVTAALTALSGLAAAVWLTPGAQWAGDTASSG
ncbi:MAG: MFS transporter [Solirubrobacterales bacterium]